MGSLFSGVVGTAASRFHAFRRECGILTIVIWFPRISSALSISCSPLTGGVPFHLERSILSRIGFQKFQSFILGLAYLVRRVLVRSCRRGLFF
jgi:hypothetical protein